MKVNPETCKVYPAPFAVPSVKDDDTNYVEPDISVICDKSKISNRGCEGAPDFVIEIVSPSSRKMDYSLKNTLTQMLTFVNTGLWTQQENELQFTGMNKMLLQLSFHLMILLKLKSMVI